MKPPLVLVKIYYKVILLPKVCSMQLPSRKSWGNKTYFSSIISHFIHRPTAYDDDDNDTKNPQCQCDQWEDNFGRIKILNWVSLELSITITLSTNQIPRLTIFKKVWIFTNFPSSPFRIPAKLSTKKRFCLLKISSTVPTITTSIILRSSCQSYVVFLCSS